VAIVVLLQGCAERVIDIHEDVASTTDDAFEVAETGMDAEVELVYPDHPTPEPDGPGCARFFWLPEGCAIDRLSADGRTGVGTRGSGDRMAFAWRDGTLHWLGRGTQAIDINRDGTTILVEYQTRSVDPMEILLWRESGDLESVALGVNAVAISADGDSFIGNGEVAYGYELFYSLYYGPHALLWTRAGIEWLPFQRISHDVLMPWRAVSSNGDLSIVLGVARSWNGGDPNVIVLSQGALSTLDTLAEAVEMSSRGDRYTARTSSVPVRALRGQVGSEDAEQLDFRGFELGLQTMDDDCPAPGHHLCKVSPRAISADGSVVFAEAGVWREGEGTRSVTELLDAACIDTAAIFPDLFGWSVSEISEDSTTIAGCARRLATTSANRTIVVADCWVASNVTL